MSVPIESPYLINTKWHAISYHFDVIANYFLNFVRKWSLCIFRGNVHCSVTVTVTEALVLRPLLEDRRITESIRILMPIDRMKQKCFQSTMKWVCRSQQFQWTEMDHCSTTNTLGCCYIQFSVNVIYVREYNLHISVHTQPLLTAISIVLNYADAWQLCQCMSDISTCALYRHQLN